MALATHLLGNYNVFVEYIDARVEADDVPAIPKMDERDWTVDSVREFDGVVVVDGQELDMKVVEDARAQGTCLVWSCEV